MEDIFQHIVPDKMDGSQLDTLREKHENVMWYTDLECFRVEAQPEGVSIIPGAQRVPHDLDVFEIREVRVHLKKNIKL